MLPVGHCQVPPPLEMMVVGSQQGLRCGSICPVTTGQESVVNRCATSPHSIQISHPCRQGLSTQETILSDHLQQCTVLPRCCLSGNPWRLAWHQRSSGSMPFEYAVDGSTSQTHTGSNSTLLNALTGKCKHLMPNTHRGWTGGIVRTIRKTFEKICKYWFKVVTVWRLIWGNDHLYCGFGARGSHLTLHWMSAQGSVGFRWGTITGPYHVNFSQVETQKFDPHWFYCLQLGCNNLFCQECIMEYCVSIGISTRKHIDELYWLMSKIDECCVSFVLATYNFFLNVYKFKAWTISCFCCCLMIFLFIQKISLKITDQR